MGEVMKVATWAAGSGEWRDNRKAVTESRRMFHTLTLCLMPCYLTHAPPGVEARATCHATGSARFSALPMPG